MVAGEEGGGVGVVAEAEEDEVERGRGVVGGVFAEQAAEQQFVAAGVRLGIARFGRHFVDVLRFDADVADERFAGHAVVAVGVARRQVAFVALEEQRTRPGKRDRVRVAGAAAGVLRQGVAKLQVSTFDDAFGELPVDISRRVAAREPQREAATFGHSAVGGVGNEGGGTIEKLLARRGDPVGHHGVSSRSSRAFAAMLAAVKPKCSITFGPGADAPKWSMPITAPPSPAMSCQPKVAAASTTTRARTDGGSTAARYSGGCSANSSRDGIETTRAAYPRASISALASSARCTSEPVATMIIRRWSSLPSAQSAST